jgi:hypothetical protein
VPSRQPTDAALDAATTGWRYDAVTHSLWIKIAPGGTVMIEAS